ncbi:hypothetical protein [Actinoplanes siamensis]|uniref:Uncharacterized protein n=1 Tax=Actinoplanes siamensis TaxID=1223317 RepID=A0A919TJB1_9ACTN|nr:hypothetical protein [Actinoplanes siamensis]GIF04329.1 hypothetical protein Asi03nite_18670 [Actinoplanes siamensis]
MYRILLTSMVAAGAVIAPAPARAADTTTSLTGAQMYAALKGVAGTTAAAELAGFGGDYRMSVTEDGATATGTGKFAVDPDHGLGYVTTTGAVTSGPASFYAAAGRGEYLSLTGTGPAAAKMAGHPSATYSFQPDPALTLDAWLEGVPVPSGLIGGDARHPGTKTVHDDGTTDYTYTDADHATFVFTTSATGLFGAVEVTQGTDRASLTFDYGPQTVTLPPDSSVIAKALLDKATAYLDMAGSVRRAALAGAATATAKSGGRAVRASTIRTWARSEARTVNDELGFKVVAVTDIKGGVHVSAKNPFTGATVTWSVKAVGKRAVATKG